MYDAYVNGVYKMESLLTEINPDGSIIKNWDLGEIFSAHMNANGDNASLFVRDGKDWCHMNDAFYDARDDSIGISCRENFIVKLDYQTGNIKWLLGDTTKYWATFPSLMSLALNVQGTPPIGQHGISIANDGNLLVFNNGLATIYGRVPIGESLGIELPYSLVQKFTIDEANQSGIVVWEYDAAIYSRTTSSAYQDTTTVNGDYLINYSAKVPNKIHIINENQQLLSRFQGGYFGWNAAHIDLSNINY